MILRHEKAWITMHYPEELKLIPGGISMENNNCENCGFRAKYDNNPKSFLGWLWRWHVIIKKLYLLLDNNISLINS